MNDPHEVATSTCTPLAVTAETAAEGVSRRAVLAGLAASCGAALLLLQKPSRALTNVGNTDAQVLRFLEEVELMQADFFMRATRSPAFAEMEPRERDVFALLALQDDEHAMWFRLARQKLGVAEFGHFYTPNTSQSRPPRIFNFPGKDFDTRQALFAAAVTMKELSVAAYHGAVGNAKNGELVQALAALAGIEGRHATALREIGGVDAFVGAFEPAMSQGAIARRLEGSGFSNIPLM